MKLALKSIYTKLLLVLVIFIFVLIFYLFSFKFYQKNLFKKIEQINNFKMNEANNQLNIELTNRQKQLINVFKQKSGKNLDDILTLVEAKLNRNSNQIVQLFKEKGWQFTENKSSDLNILKIDLNLKPEEFNNFLSFLIDEALFLKINSLKLIKSEQNYQINLEFSLNK